MAFLRAIDRTANPHDVQQLLLMFLKDHGIEYFFVGTIPNPGLTSRQQQTHVLLATYPVEWQRRYFSAGYLYKDPVVQAVCTGTNAVTWAEVRGRCDQGVGRRVLNEATECGLAQGFTVPMLTMEGSTGGFSFAGARLELSDADRRTLTLIANFTFGHLLLMNERPAARAIALAPRERESLQWAAEGKSDWEIGTLMGISQHGADRHLRSARRKLGTSSRTQAVAQAIRLGLIS